MIANLDCEEELAAGAAGSAGSGTRARPRTLSAAARAATAGFGTLLRALAVPGDRLWIPGPVAADRLPEVPGLPSVELLTGRLETVRPTPGAAVLAWGETPSVEALRHRTGRPDEAPLESGATPELPGWIGALRRLPPADPAVVARVHDRRYCLEVQRTLGCALPGAGTVQSVEGLDRHLRTGAAAAGSGLWVAKAPLSAAGRHRVIGEGRAELDQESVRRRLEQLLERFGSLVVEPWVPRGADFGCTALLDGSGAVRALGCHRLEVDRRGAFVGLVLGEAGEVLAVGEREQLERTLRAVGRALADAGYAGPFGIDAFRWRDHRGVGRFHPLSEINARMTFGLVARALAERVRTPGAGAVEASGGPPRRSPGALRLGRTPPVVSGGEVLVPLVHPAGRAPGAWLRCGSG